MKPNKWAEIKEFEKRSAAVIDSMTLLMKGTRLTSLQFTGVLVVCMKIYGITMRVLDNGCCIVVFVLYAVCMLLVASFLEEQLYH